MTYCYNRSVAQFDEVEHGGMVFDVGNESELFYSSEYCTESCSSNGDLRYHEWLYFLVVTSGTVGFGDISPATPPGKAVTMLLIVFIVILIPLGTNELLYLMSMTTPWERARYRTAPGSQRWHVLVVGDLTSTSLREFLHEILHQDHKTDVDNTYLECVILQTSAPTYEMRELLRDKAYAATLIYLQGSPLNTGDLARAHAEMASAIFVFCNKVRGGHGEVASFARKKRAVRNGAACSISFLGVVLGLF